jgi:YD repeat-containing protein
MKYTRDSGGAQYHTESRSYNLLGRMTQIQIPGVMDRSYTFSATANDGRITQMADAVSGETVVYQYDSLTRLASAATTGPQWGQGFAYDPFGNLLTQTVTKGSAPNMSVAVSGTTDRITTGGYSWARSNSGAPRGFGIRSAPG